MSPLVSLATRKMKWNFCMDSPYGLRSQAGVEDNVSASAPAPPHLSITFNLPFCPLTPRAIIIKILAWMTASSAPQSLSLPPTRLEAKTYKEMRPPLCYERLLCRDIPLFLRKLSPPPSSYFQLHSIPSERNCASLRQLKSPP